MFFPCLRLEIAPEGKSLGEYIGFKVRYDNENEAIDPNLDIERREALEDVNKRRVGYEVCAFPSIHRDLLTWSLQLSGRLARVVYRYKRLVRWVYNNFGYSN